MLHKFNQFSEELLLESTINESIIYFSPKMREQLNRVNNDISKKLLELEGQDIPNVDVTFIDCDVEGNVTFITMANAIKLIKDKYPEATNADLDVSGNKQVADYVYLNDMNAKSYGRANGDTGVYIKSRNTIKIGKLVNKVFKGTLKASEVENFVNDFKASSPSNIEKIELVSGESIKYWYDTVNYQSTKGTLGSSCMGGKDKSFFNLYSENKDTCSLLIMTVDGKLVARALVWKLNSIESKPGEKELSEFDLKPVYFLDRVYSIEDYQVEKMRRFAIDKGWAIRKDSSVYSNDRIIWKGTTYEVDMSVKVKKSNYGNTFPYMDTFRRYNHFNGTLHNDDLKRKGGHILQSTQGGYDKSISRSKMYINRFKDFFSGD